MTPGNQYGRRKSESDFDLRERKKIKRKMYSGFVRTSEQKFSLSESYNR